MMILLIFTLFSFVLYKLSHLRETILVSNVITKYVFLFSGSFYYYIL